MAFRGERLKAVRERVGLTQSELAERIKAGANSVYRYETLQAEPSAEVLYRLSTELSVTTDWLLGLIDDEAGHVTAADLSPVEHKLLDAFRRGDFRNLVLIAAENTPKTGTEE